MIGSGGSGLYAGTRGPLIKYMSIPGRDNNKLLVAKVPKYDNYIEKVEEDHVEKQIEKNYEDFMYEVGSY